VCDPYLLLHCGGAPAGEQAGRGPREAITADDPSDPRSAAVYRAVAALRGDWRSALTAHYRCDDTGGFSARLCYAGSAGEPYGPALRWATEEHYCRASMLAPRGPGDASGPARDAFIYLFSLDSGSPLSLAPGAARTLALTGQCRVAREGGPPAEYAAPAGVTANPDYYEETTLRNVAWRAKVARYAQHPASRRVLLATGRAVITTRTAWAPVTLEIGTMAVRAMLQQSAGGGGLAGPGDEEVAAAVAAAAAAAGLAPAHATNQVPPPLAATDVAAAELAP